MSYQQTLVKELKDIVNPTILKKQNRYKNWEYGYNVEYDFVVISKTGKIGQIIEIQNLRIALPAVDESYNEAKIKRNNTGKGLNTQTNYKELKQDLTGKNIL